jgi:hypothetical protein
MKTKLLVILCVMIFAGAVMVGPVAADTKQTTITGNISSTMSLVVNGAITDWNLVYPGDQKVNIVTLNVTSNYPGWTVTVNDSLDSAGGNPKNITTRGKMAQSNSGGAYVGENNLTTAMQIQSTSTIHYTGNGALISLGTVDPGVPILIYTGDQGYLSAGNFDPMALTIAQPIQYADRGLPPGDKYKIILTFVATIN